MPVTGKGDGDGLRVVWRKIAGEDAERRFAADSLWLVGKKVGQMTQIVGRRYIYGMSCKRLTKEEKVVYGGCVRECPALDAQCASRLRMPDSGILSSI